MNQIRMLPLSCILMLLSITPAMADDEQGQKKLWGVCHNQAAAEKWLQIETEYTFDWDLGKSMRARTKLLDSDDCEFGKGIAHAGHEIVARRKTNYLNSEFVLAKYDETTFVIMEEKNIDDFRRLVSLCSNEDHAEIVAGAFAKTNDAKVSTSKIKALSKGKCKIMNIPAEDSDEFEDEGAPAEYSQYNYIKRSLHNTQCGSYDVGEITIKDKIVYTVAGHSDNRYKCN